MDLKVATFLSPNYYPLYRFVAETMGQQIEATGLEFSQGNTFEEFQNGEFDLAFACGYWYAHKTGDYTPLAAPVLADTRYKNRSAYFVDLILRAESPLESFDDLAGQTFAYNEEYSFSGYHALRSELTRKNLTFAYFGRSVKTGSHLGSIEAVLDGAADVAAIDSTVLAYEFNTRPNLVSRLKILTSFGPYPAPPLLANRNLPENRRRQIQTALANLPAAKLAEFGIKSYQPVNAANYAAFEELASCSCC